MPSLAKFLTVGLFVALLAPAAGAPTPVPGGANGVSAVSGKLGDTVFNGVLRIKIVALREATDADHSELAARSSDLTATPDKKVLVMQSLLRNGAHDEFIDLLQYTLADKDDVSVEIPSNASKMRTSISCKAPRAASRARFSSTRTSSREAHRAVRHLRRSLGFSSGSLYHPEPVTDAGGVRDRYSRPSEPPVTGCPEAFDELGRGRA